ncbi:uncharacterized protein LOC114903841 [Monodon monoceros]|uniref:uncharacterized protein LOC114903841 n=1 Tax=Monodon monoceros TaxID=40151 RepID=UPI0010F58A9D|nr:uncharacterized protein LOC114903841 [Monodon monoceros]
MALPASWGAALGEGGQWDRELSLAWCTDPSAFIYMKRDSVTQSLRLALVSADATARARPSSLGPLSPPLSHDFLLAPAGLQVGAARGPARSSPGRRCPRTPTWACSAPGGGRPGALPEAGGGQGARGRRRQGAGEKAGSPGDWQRAGAGARRKPGAGPASERASREGGGQREARLPRRRDLRIKASEASKVWLGVGLSFLEAALKQPPRAETQTFFCHSEPRGLPDPAPLLPARPPPLRPSPRLGSRPGRRAARRAPPAAAPRPGREHRQVRRELRRSLGGRCLPRPSTPLRPRRPAAPSPAGGAPRRPRALPSHVVHPALHPPDREAPAGLEEGRAERAGGEVVREGGQEFGQEAQEDGAAGRAGEGHHHAERQHQVHHHPQVTRTAPGIW